MANGLTSSSRISSANEALIYSRALTSEDAEDFRRVRLLGLRESPAAFGASYAQEEKLAQEEFQRRLSGSPDRGKSGIMV